MDVHAPHEPIHTWRDIALHLGIVTVGLFIALSLEAFVEHLHNRHLVAEARANIREELESNHQAAQRDLVYLQQDILPDIDVWRSEFEKIANGSYVMRGIEMTLSDMVTKKQLGADEQLTLAGTSTRPELVLAPFQATSKIEWDMKAQAPRPISEAEAGAYTRLSAALADHPAGVTVQVTGRLQKHGANEFSLDVREFEVVDAAIAS